jgi:hypothetical protein
MPPKPVNKNFNQIFVCVFSLENYDVDERLQKDIGDYIAARMARSRAIQAGWSRKWFFLLTRNS